MPAEMDGKNCLAEFVCVFFIYKSNNSEIFLLKHAQHGLKFTCIFLSCFFLCIRLARVYSFNVFLFRLCLRCWVAPHHVCIVWSAGPCLLCSRRRNHRQSREYTLMHGGPAAAHECLMLCLAETQTICLHSGGKRARGLHVSFGARRDVKRALRIFHPLCVVS